MYAKDLKAKLKKMLGQDPEAAVDPILTASPAEFAAQLKCGKHHPSHLHAESCLEHKITAIKGNPLFAAYLDDLKKDSPEYHKFISPYYAKSPVSYQHAQKLYDYVSSSMLNSGEVFFAAADGKITPVAKATDIKVSFAGKYLAPAMDDVYKQLENTFAKTLAEFNTTPLTESKIFETSLTPWGVNEIQGGPPSPKVTAPKQKPKLQGVHERLLELSKEMPYEPPPHQNYAGGSIFTSKMSHLDWALDTGASSNYIMDPWPLNKPSLTVNGHTIPGDDIELLEQSNTAGGHTSISVKFKTGKAYDKWTKLLGTEVKHFSAPSIGFIKEKE